MRISCIGSDLYTGTVVLKGVREKTPKLEDEINNGLPE